MKLLMRCIIALLFLNAVSLAHAKPPKKTATLITHGQDESPGVQAKDQSFYDSGQTGDELPSAETTSIVASNGANAHNRFLGPVANRCTGLTSNNSFSEFSNSTTCTTFAAPAPLDPARPIAARRAQPSPEQIALGLTQRAIALAPKPRLEAAPSGVGLTGLDSFFWLAAEPQPISASAGVVTAEARPTQYAWDFDDGDYKTTSNSGRRWTPRREGNITHLYETRGSYDVSVEVIWEARWRIGTGPWQQLGYFTTSDSADYPVRQVVALLVKPR